MDIDQKATNKYTDACRLLDLVQATVYELLSNGQGIDMNTTELVSLAYEIVKDYENLPEEDKKIYEEVNNKLIAGELSVEQAIEMLPKLSTESLIDNVPLMNNTVSSGTVKGKKPLLN